MWHRRWDRRLLMLTIIISFRLIAGRSSAAPLPDPHRGLRDEDSSPDALLSHTPCPLLLPRWRGTTKRNQTGRERGDHPARLFVCLFADGECRLLFTPWQPLLRNGTFSAACRKCASFETRPRQRAHAHTQVHAHAHTCTCSSTHTDIYTHTNPRR